MKILLMAVGLVGVMGSGVAIAAGPAWDGNELLGQCQQLIKLMDGEKGSNLLDVGICGGFVEGVASTVSFYGEDLKKEDKFCTPGNVTNSQLVRIVVKYLKENPKLLNKGRTGLVWSALMDAYPCK